MTRLKEHEKRNAAYGAVSQYCRHARSIVAEAPYLPTNDSGKIRHVEFDRKYARELVWDNLVGVVGEKRAENVSTAIVDLLVDMAMSYHRECVALGLWHDRGYGCVTSDNRDHYVDYRAPEPGRRV